MVEPAIAVTGLRKSYGTNEAVKGIDLEVGRGEVYAFLGPNGAGKTTTVEILEGHRARDAGDVSVLGHDPGAGERSFKEKIGIVLQETAVDPFLSVEEVIELYRGYYPHPLKLDDIIEIVGLQDKRTDKVRRLSGGQQRRLDVAIGISGDPELLFLDEPTTGFDPSARRNAWKMVADLRALGKTILLTTHYMDEAQHLADRVGIIVQGKIVAEGRPHELAPQKLATTSISFSRPAGVPLPAGIDARQADGRIVVSTTAPTHVLHSLTSWALDNGIELQELSVAKPTLEDIYLSFTAAPEQAEG